MAICCSTTGGATSSSFSRLCGRGTYDGGKKHERDARSYTVREAELGVEWQPVPSFELVAMYTLSSRRFEDFQRPSNQ